jgi:acetoin utilization protein AcuC
MAGSVIATGGGGYAVHHVVPRAWSLVWAALCEADVSDVVPDAWLAHAERDAGEALPRTLRDPMDAWTRTSHSIDAETTNRRTVDAVRTQCLPLVTGWGLGF